jgi:hypothetical protein
MRAPRPLLKLLLIGCAAAGVATVIVLAVSAFAGHAGGQGTDRRPVASTQEHADHDHAGDPAHRQPAFVRTLAVHTEHEPAPSAHPKRMRALLTAGRLPSGVVDATVLTDEDCEADATGVSHCRNELKLPSGRTFTVKHPHRMHDVPCMTPGETVRVGRAVGA